MSALERDRMELARMEELATVQKAMKKLHRRRDDLVLEAYALGISVNKIVKYTGMSKNSVYHILYRDKAIVRSAS